MFLIYQLLAIIDKSKLDSVINNKCYDKQAIFYFISFLFKLYY